MPADILVVNAGSSSIKASLFACEAGGLMPTWKGSVDGIGTGHAKIETSAGDRLPSAGRLENHDDAIGSLVEDLRDGHPDWQPAAIGHRVVHGGLKFSEPARITPDVRKELQALVPLAPLHQPANLSGIDAAAAAFPDVPQVACFDTAFHHGRPFVSEAYALPREHFDAGVRRYGFHGLSYDYIVRRFRQLAPGLADGRLIVAHLGNGASMTAIRRGRSVETTMGFTALDGLPMGTRCGQIDPGVLLMLLQQLHLSAEELTDLLYHRSGLLGISGRNSDMRDLLTATDESSRQAVEYFVYRAVEKIGALTACLDGLDAVVFTAGIGEHSPAIRERICARLDWLGVELDADANGENRPLISSSASRIAVWVIPTDEEKMIAEYTARVVELPGHGSV